jgi:cell division protein FtsB
MKKKKDKKIYYSYLTIFLVFFAVHLSVMSVYYIVKLVNYSAKLTKLQTIYQEALQRKEDLTAEIEGFKSPEAYEAFLRNHLKYAADDEILVIITERKR